MKTLPATDTKPLTATASKAILRVRSGVRAGDGTVPAPRAVTVQQSNFVDGPNASDLMRDWN